MPDPSPMTAADILAAGGFAPGMTNAQKGSLIATLLSTVASVTMIGQSNEHGTVQVSDTAYSQAHASLYDPSVRSPIAPSVNRNGGYLCGVHDELLAEGVRVTMVNAAVPSLSFQLQTAGFLKPLERSKPYVMQRAPAGEGDLGDVGDIVVYTPSGQAARFYQCITGRARTAFFSSMSTQNPGGGGALQTSISQAGTQTTGTDLPATIDSVAVGGEFTDGTCAFRRLDATQIAGATSNLNVFTLAGQAGRGHDPLGVINRAARETARLGHGGPRIALIMNGQSDLGAGPNTYSAVLQSIAESCLRQGFTDVMIGLTNWSPLSTGATIAAYDNLSTGVDQAIAALAQTYPGRVWAGPNLYRLMGTTGPMAAGGAFMQGDGIHLNAAGSVGPAVAGVSSAKVHVANAIKAVLRAKGVMS